MNITSFLSVSKMLILTYNCVRRVVAKNVET